MPEDGAGDKGVMGASLRVPWCSVPPERQKLSYTEERRRHDAESSIRQKSEAGVSMAFVGWGRKLLQPKSERQRVREGSANTGPHVVHKPSCLTLT